MTGYLVHPAADVFPLIEGEELQKLVDDIKANGLRHHGTLSHDRSTIIDGRNRDRACEIAGVEMTWVTLPEGYTEQQIIDYIVSANLRRRDLTAGQRATAGAKLEPMYAEAAKERMLAGKKDPRDDRPQGSAEERKSRDRAAKAAGTSGKSVSQVKALERDAPDLAEKVAAGTMTLNAAVENASSASHHRRHPSSASRRPRPSRRQSPLIRWPTVRWSLPGVRCPATRKRRSRP